MECLFPRCVAQDEVLSIFITQVVPLAVVVQHYHSKTNETPKPLQPVSQGTKSSKGNQRMKEYNCFVSYLCLHILCDCPQNGYLCVYICDYL